MLALVAAALSLCAPRAFSQGAVLLREVASREVSLHVGGVESVPVKEVASREISIFVENGRAGAMQVASREYDLLNVTDAPPPAVTGLTVTSSPTGAVATLDWSAYNQWAIGDIVRFDIYLSDTGPITDVTGLTPYQSVGGGTSSLVLSGLTALRDHFFAIVAVDGLGHFLPAVNYSAAYVLSPQTVSREMSLFIGADPAPPYRQVASREIDLVVVSTAPPPAITGLVVTSSPSGDSATLDWGAYNQWAVGDIVRFDIFLSDTGAFSDVTGRTPFRTVGAGATSLTLTGLTPGRDHFFAIVAVDALGNFTPAVNYSAAYVLSPQVVSRETSIFIGAEPPSPVRQVASREMSVVVPDAAVPAPVTGVGSGFIATTSTTEFGAVDLDWTSYNELAQRDVVLYRIYVGNNFFDTVNGLTPYQIVQSGRQRQTVTGLNGNGIYHFAVVAEDALGGFNPTVRSFSAQASIAGVGEATNLAGTSGANSILFTWAAPTDAGAFLQGYRVYFAGSTTPVPLPPSATSYQATGLQPATGYNFRITTIDPFGGESGGVTLLGATLLPNPTGIDLTARNGEAVMLWNAAQPAALVSFYEVYRANASFTNISAATKIAAGPATEATLGSFAAVSGKHYAVVTVNVLGSSDPAVVSVAATKQIQTINFPAPTVSGSAPIRLNATASSGLPVSFAALPVGLAQIATGGPTPLLTALSGGRVTVTASQNGNANFWPADPVPQIARLLPVITSFTASGLEITGGMTLRNIDEGLRVVALDADGIAQAEFFIRPASGGAFTSLGVDNVPGNGLGVNLRIDAYATGLYELKVVVSTPEGITNEVTRAVRLELGPPPRPILKIPENGTYFDTPIAEVHGVGSRGAQVFIMRNGVDVAGPLTALEFTANITLLPGENVFTARAVNAAGESPASLPLTYTLRSLLTIEVTPQSLTEGAAGMIRAVRNHAQGAVTVTLGASVPGQLTLPASLTVANGATEASIGFSAVNNTTAEADQAVTITGSAGGYVAGSATVTVLDDDRTSLPDLIVTGITAPAQALPGQEIEIVWTLKNDGVGKAPAGWTDQIFISDDNLIGNDRLIGTATATVALNAGQSVERRARVTLPALAAGAKFIVIRTNAGGDFLEESAVNNSAVDDAALTIQTALALALSRPSAPENLGPFNATVSRNGDPSVSLVATLTAAPDGLVTLPATVNFGAGESSATFSITPVNDDIVNGPRNATITAQAAGYADASAALAITDDESATLAITIAPAVVPEAATNPAATGTVRRNTRTADALTVSLISSNPSAATAPATVVIPAGSASATFPITIKDDNVRTPNRTARFTASAAGLPTSSATIELTDDDIPGITLRLLPNAVSENAANPATQGRIVRDRVATGDVVIQFASSNTASVVVPATVTIPVDATSVDFPIAVIDNATTDGARNVTITATETDSVLKAPIPEQSVQATLRVFDDEGATLALSASAATVVTGTSINGTVTRLPGAIGALTVALVSGDPAIIVPASVQLANGVAVANFSIQAAAGLTSAASATITASAAGLNSAALGITAISAQQPDLVVAEVTPSVTTSTGGSTINVSWMIANDGSAPATGTWSDRVFLTTNRQATGGTAGQAFSASGPVGPGEGYTRTAEITLPTAPGRYWVVVQTDALAAVAEGSEANNALVAAVPIDVAPAYRVTVATDIDLAASGTPIPLAGQALRTGDSAPVPNVPVSLRILVNGTRRVLKTLTDASGNYLTTFRPLATEAGHYTVAAAQPEVTEDVVQDDFDLIGVGADPAGLDLRLAVNQPLSGELDLRNSSDLPLTGLTAVAQTGAGNIVTVLTPPAALGAGATAKLQYTMTATNSAFTRAKVVFHLTSAEGAVLDVPVQVTVLPLAAQLVATPGTLTRGMLRGAQSLVECELVNLGSAPTGDLGVELPSNFPWLGLSSPAAIPSLAPGERTKITLQLLPAANLPLQLFTGSIFVRGAQSGLSIPFQFRAISEAVGDVRISVLDDYTYYTAGAPRVADATVKMRDPFDQSIIVAQGLTDATGAITLPAVPEGSYFLEVSAAKHGTYRNGFVVVPGITNAKDVFLDRQTVTYSWSVVPTEIPDRYEIKLISTFEVDVPVPVVTMEVTPTNTIPELLPGESYQVDVTLTNHGLIAAEQISLNVPALDSGFEFIPLIRQLDKIAAKSSVTIPMIIRRPVAGIVAAALKDGLRFAGPGGGGGGGSGCTPFVIAIYSYECGPDRRYHQTGQPFIISGQSCPGGGVPIFPRGTGGPGGTFSVGPGVATDSSCDPCAFIKAKALFDCAINFIPGHDIPKCIYGIYNCLSDPNSATAPISCSRTLYDCSKAGLESTPVNYPLAIFDCAVGFTQAYIDCQEKLAGGGGGAGGAMRASRTVARFSATRSAGNALALAAPAGTTSNLPELSAITEWIARLQDELDAITYLYGDRAWLAAQADPAAKTWFTAFVAAFADGSDGGARISDAERASLLALPLPAPVTVAMAGIFLDRYNRTFDYNAAGIINLADVPAGQSTDFFAKDVALAKLARFDQARKLSLAEGFESPAVGLADALKQFRDQGPKKTQGVCARVKIEIDQQAVLTRQAFSGTLEVTNGSESSTIEGVSVVLDIRDENGASANDKFFIKGPEVSGLANTGGSGALAPTQSARLQYTFIPTRDAAPNAPTVYSFAGTLHYTDNGQQVALPMLASPVTVYPDARLVLKYFQQRDVYSDDPFTLPVEPAEPFALGLIVTNTGGGIAKNFSITSAQPKIIENRKGLLIDFKIIGTQVGAESRDPSLTVNLGDLDPGESQVAQFLLTASLQGKFIDYQASYEHAGELGGAATSLIDSVEIHELIHVVRDDRAGADNLPDFLTNEVTDANSLPDTLFLSNGTIAPVNAATNAAVTIGTLQGTLTANMPGGWSYVRLPDPGAGLKLVRAVRSDGKVLRVGDNVWQTDRSFPNELTGARRERLIHLLDFNGTGSYVLYYTVADDGGLLTPPVQIAQLGPVNPALRDTPLDSIDVTFTRPIDPATLTAADVTVSANGAAGVVANGVTITPLGETAYRISGFAGLNAAEGTYTISVQAGTVADVAGRAGQGAATAVWAVSTSHLAVVSAGAFGGATIRGPVATIDVVFSGAVDAGTFSVDDLALSRDGGANLLTPAVTITQTAPTTFRIGGLGALIAASGGYAFTVNASTINDAGGLAGVGMLTERFTIDATGPTIESLDEIVPNPRNSSISTLDLAFSKPIAASTFDAADLKLLRNGKPISLGTTHLIALDARRFRLAGLAESTGIAGSYTLEVNAAGVTDALGNPGSGSVMRTWTLSTKQPAAPTGLAIAPDRGVSATDKITNTTAVALTGAVAAGVTRVRATDRTTGADLGEGPVTGTKFNLPVLFGVAGFHEVAVVALDAAGNVSPASTARIFADLTAPTVTIEAVSPTPRETPVTAIAVTFSELLNAVTFTRADLTLKRDGTTVPLTAAVTILPGAGGAYVINGLGLLTDTAGVYDLSVAASGVEDLAGNAGQGSASVRWRRLDGSKLKQFGPFAGSYNGVILADEPAHATSGIINVVLTRVGGFTANATYGGKKVSLKGSLDADGKFTGLAGKGAAALGVTLTLVTDEGANAMVGTIGGSTGKTSFIADRLIFSKTTPTPLAGKYVALLTAGGGAAPGALVGDGVGVVTVARDGTLSVSGELADGTKFSQKTALGGDDEWPFYVPMDAGKSSAVARIFFREIAGLSDLDGTAYWFRAARPSAAAYRSAFTALLPLVGSAYTPPVAGQAVFDFGTVGQKAEMILSGVGIDPDLVLPFSFDATGKGVFPVPGSSLPQLKLSLPDGRVSGSALLPGDKAVTKFRGVAFPKQKGGSGYFIRLRSGGTVELKPAP